MLEMFPFLIKINIVPEMVFSVLHISYLNNVFYTYRHPLPFEHQPEFYYWTHLVWQADVLRVLKIGLMLHDLLEGLTGLRKSVHTVTVYCSEEVQINISRKKRLRGQRPEETKDKLPAVLSL